MNKLPSLTQRVMFAILPRTWARAIEAESRSWIMTCSNCSATQSVWDAGGIRWKAKGSPFIRARCSACHQYTVQRITQNQEHGND